MPMEWMVVVLLTEFLEEDLMAVRVVAGDVILLIHSTMR